MAKVRVVEIKNFRGIKELTWYPESGINCLIGPGDSGKSSVLDALDFCLGARRNLQFTDADFHQLDVATPITVKVTLGELDDDLEVHKTDDSYLWELDVESNKIKDESEKNTETVLTVKLTVDSDLEPDWTLVSDQAEAQGKSGKLKWGDRTRLAPTRIGAMADYHLGWRRGSVLNVLSEKRVDMSALVKAGRAARESFGDQAQDQLNKALDIVTKTAKKLGIPIGENIKALLDSHAVSLSGGTISLHDKHGVPLRGLGAGSTRLLLAGLQREAAKHSPIVLIDELEHGLEPHRIIRFLDSLGAKKEPPPLQVFMTTHSPTALRELRGSQLFVMRGDKEKHELRLVGTDDDIQSTIRLYPEAFLARGVIICEGASEFGFIRGLDQYRTANHCDSINALGVTPVDSRGGGADRPFKRANAFRSLGYRSAVLRDNDEKPTESVKKDFIEDGGRVFTWGDGNALEDELFAELSDDGVEQLLDLAVELLNEEKVKNHIESASNGAANLNTIHAEIEKNQITSESRKFLGKAARTKDNGWFKSVTKMERVANEIVGPDLESASDNLKNRVKQIFDWTSEFGH